MRSLNVLAVLLSSGLALSAQTVISAHSGTVHLAEGAVTIDGKPVVQKFGTFPDWKERSELRTEAGRVEILLTPGVFLRVGENSAVRLIDNRLSATRVELLAGKAVVEADSPMKENAVTMVVGDYEIQVRKSSVFGIESEPGQLKVYHGEAAVAYKGDLVTVKAGHLLPFGAALAMEKFDAKDGDELTRWSQRRSEYVSAANVSSAKTLKDSGSSWSSNGWYYNPFYSMYTYIPGSGAYFNPYGYGFFSPYSVYNYLPYGGYGYGGGYYGRNNGYGGNSGYGRSGGYNNASAYAASNGRTGDQGGSFGRNSNAGLNSGASSASNAGFGRGSGSTSAGVSAGAPAGAVSAGHSGGSFSGGGAVGGGSRGSK